MELSNKLFVEMESHQLTKHGEAACGDDCKFHSDEEGHRYIAVLSDGLGSGIKAHLLSTMTTTMAVSFIRSDMDVLKSVETIMDSLPVCEVRKISYSTFTIIDIQLGGKTRVIEMDNPGFVHMRGGIEIPAPEPIERLVSDRWPSREVRVYEIDLRPGDHLVVCSDGVTQAGLGLRRYPFGWRRKGLVEFLKETLIRYPRQSARTLSRDVTCKAMSLDAGGDSKDDTSCLVVHIRHPRVMRILTGPPYRKSTDHDYALLAAPGGGADCVAVCGGTTTNIVSRELGIPVEMDIRRGRSDLPPAGKLGAALATEGVLTLTRLLEDLEDGKVPEEMPHAAAALAELAIESDEIEFYVGTKINEAHQDPALPVDLELRRSVVKRLSKVLQTRYRKRTIIQYY